MTTVILCPGQGAQTVGMAKELIESGSETRALYDRAKDILGWDIAELCINGPASDLNRTDHTQPALYLHSCAAIDRLRAGGLDWSIAMGHSAGEYAALYALQAWSFEEGLEVIAERARLMNEAGAEARGTMAVCLGLHPDRIAEVCQEVDSVVVLANRNAPAQGVVSGAVEAVKAVAAPLKEAGAKRVLPIKVSGAFHSPLMATARERFEAFLSARDPEALKAPQGVWISNRTGQPEADPSIIRESLAAQLTSPVHWIESMTWLAEQGTPQCVEAGTGNVLRGLLKTNRVDTPAWGASSPEEIQNVLTEVQS